MTDTNKQKYRDDFELGDFGYKLNFDKDAVGFYLHPSVELQWNGYYVARKKAHSENEDAFKAFTLDLADRYEKEIELLKAELKAERLQNDKTLEFIDKHDHIDISWFPLNYDLEETVKNRRIAL